MKLHVTKPALQTFFNALKRAPTSLRMARELAERGDIAQAVKICGNVMLDVGNAGAGLYEGGSEAAQEMNDAAKAVAAKHNDGVDS